MTATMTTTTMTTMTTTTKNKMRTKRTCDEDTTIIKRTRMMRDDNDEG